MDCEDNDYPSKLSFTCPHTRVNFERVINSEDEADDVFDWFFSKWGFEVPYSIDGVNVPAAEIVSEKPVWENEDHSQR